MASSDFSKANFTFFLDTHFGTEEDHFIRNQNKFPLIEIDAGCEAKSFLAQLDYVMNLNLNDETILYFLEDDYLHKNGWEDILVEGLTLPDIDYITLFDDRDKYFAEQYSDLTAKLFHSKSCHWRTTPSTTNTYAMCFNTLKKHLPVHREFSENREISSDYDKFCHLQQLGATLISSIPGWSTHMEPEHASPCFDWENLLNTISIPSKSGIF